jgi:hypothetical protein
MIMSNDDGYTGDPVPKYEPYNPFEVDLGDVLKFHQNSAGNLTKREYFAGLMMQAIVSRVGVYNFDVSANAVLYADELIRELGKK